MRATPRQEGGDGPFAPLGDRASALLSLRDRLEGRLRLTVNLPAGAIADASALGLRSGTRVDGSETVRIGWAKAYVDGALGSRTAALFEPYTCGPPGQTGIPRLSPEELDALIAAGRGAGSGWRSMPSATVALPTCWMPSNERPPVDSARHRTESSTCS